MPDTDTAKTAEPLSPAEARRSAARLFRSQAVQLAAIGIPPTELAIVLVGVGVEVALSGQTPEQVAQWLREVADFAVEQSNAGCAGNA